MKKVLYVYGGPEFHPTEAGGKMLAEMLAADGRFVLEMTDNLDAFALVAGQRLCGGGGQYHRVSR